MLINIDLEYQNYKRINTASMLSIINQIQSFKMDQDYRGLSNIGATCYMNSLLQTLYMTPQFRQAVYEWKYNQRIHPKPEDSILYQLQKLFGKLDKKFPGQITTKELVKSFQWQDQQAQMQQDIQQFNRVLFQALQKSLKNKKQTEQQSSSHFVRDLYEGQMIHFTHCKQCETQSQKEEIFQDLILTVKNPYQKIYNSCVELGLQRYMKPEILDKDNLYLCQSCQKKVPAERGVRFLKMPKLLNIILRRFDFDYFTYQRIKVNDRVQFPHILNMNNYMQGYDHIQNKLNEDSSAYFIQKQTIKKQPPFSSTTNYKKVVPKKSGAPNIAGKITTKPSANTKSFLAAMRKEKMKSPQQSQDLFFVSGNSQMVRKQESISPASTKLSQDQPIVNNQNLSASVEQSLKQQKIPISNPTNKTLNQQAKLSNNEIKSETKTQDSLQNQQKNQDSKNQKTNESPINQSKQKQLSAEQQNAKKIQQRKNDLQEQNKKNLQLIQQYLKEGSLVYQLYAVLVHNGSATHGHYFTYIKSYQNNLWYCFNDDRVSEISVYDIEKTFGGVGHSNAYALYYRQVNGKQGEEDRKIRNMPNYIELKIEQQIQSLRRRQKEKVQNLQNVIILKIYYQLSVKMIEMNKSSSLELCLLKSREMFDITQSVGLQNTRLRMFNPVSETKLQTYTGRQKMSLEDLKLTSYKSLLLEIKKQNEVFQQFVMGKINLRIVLWQQCKDKIKSLDESFLTLHKVSVTRGSIMKEVQKIIQQKRKQILNLNENEPDNICIVKRHQNDQYSYHQIINLFDYKEKNLDELMVMQNQILFIQPDSNKLMWPQQFENELYRITIKYVNGETGRIDTYLTDSRKTIGDIKKELCVLVGFQQNDTIIRRGNKSGMELKNLSSTMKDARFISGTQVYLQKGLPAKPGQVRIQLYIATDAPEDCYNRLHQFQFVADVPINGQWKASQVKQLLGNVLKKYKNIELKTNQFRIREKVCDKIGKIYRERPMKQQQLIEKRQIAVQRQAEIVEGKDFLVYIRIWDPEAWTLSKKIEVNVSKTTSMKDLAIIISTLNQDVPIQDMEICRILSINKFNILDLCEMEYFQMTDASVISEPLFVNADGLMFIVKSIKKQPRNLTKQQQTKFGGNIKSVTKTIRGRQNMPSSNIKKQKGVSIKVVENNQQYQELPEKNRQVVEQIKQEQKEKEKK